MLIPSSSSLIKSRLQRERERWREIVSDIKTWDPSRGVRQPKVFWHSRLLTSLAWAALSSSRNSPSHNSLAKLPGLLDFIIFDLWCDVMWCDVMWCDVMWVWVWVWVWCNICLIYWPLTWICPPPHTSANLWLFSPSLTSDDGSRCEELSLV